MKAFLRQAQERTATTRLPPCVHFPLPPAVLSQRINQHCAERGVEAGRGALFIHISSKRLEPKWLNMLNGSRHSQFCHARVRDSNENACDNPHVLHSYLLHSFGTSCSRFPSAVCIDGLNFWAGRAYSGWSRTFLPSQSCFDLSSDTLALSLSSLEFCRFGSSLLLDTWIFMNYRETRFLLHCSQLILAHPSSCAAAQLLNINVQNDFLRISWAKLSGAHIKSHRAGLLASTKG